MQFISGHDSYSDGRSALRMSNRSSTPCPPGRVGSMVVTIRSRINQLEAEIEDRDLRLREVEHRAKNSLQLASALLALEQRRTMDPAASAALRDSARRLGALADIHRRMYACSHEGRVAVRPWLQSICDGSSDPGVRIALECPDVAWPFETASAVGLLAGEAVANAVKHARVGVEIHVRLEPGADEEGRWCLTILDDGAGLGSEVTPGLGMRILQAFTQQLNGALGFTAGVEGRGLGVRVQFPAPPQDPG